jgi:hypothetical protein
MSTWLRRNRWGLLVLPVVATLAVAANGQRLQSFWWDDELRHAAAAGTVDEWVTWTSSYVDAAGDGTRTFQVKVARIEPAAASQSSADVAGVRVTMNFRATHDQVLAECRFALLDDEGNRYEYVPTLDDDGRAAWPCVPQRHPGPSPAVFAGQQRETPPDGRRPPAWTTQPVVTVPRAARITEVLLWWEKPDYLAVQLP